MVRLAVPGARLALACTRNLNMFTLIAMGTGVAWLYSVVAILFPGLFPPAFRAADGAVPVYFEAAAVITVLVLLGQVLELRAREQTSDAIRALLDLAPATGRRIRTDGSDEEVSLDAIEVGDRLRVRPGDKVPVDGEVVEGRSSLDESMVTGESMPVIKEKGAKVIAGTLNTTGGFVMRAEKVGRDTMLARIVEMVAAAQRSRAPIQRLADQVSAWFVPAVILIAIAAFTAWAAFGPEPRFAYRAGRRRHRAHHRLPLCARARHADVHHGRVGRGAQCRRADQERRGARTHGEGRHPGGRQDRNADARQTRGGRGRAGLRLSGERGCCGSPPAWRRRASIRSRWRSWRRRRRARSRWRRSPTSTHRSEKARSARSTAAAYAWATRNSWARPGSTPASWRAGRAAAGGGATAVFLAVDGRLAAVIAIADPVKDTTPAALAALRQEGVRVVMLTGDNRTTAKAVAARLGIEEVEAEVLPDRKSAVVERLRREGRVVAMAGDGVNDAPALAAADVGIAMGTGTDVAMESAGVTLLKGDLTGIVRARRLSAATMRNIRQNLFLAFVYNAAGVPIAAGVLYPLFGILLSPIVAAAAMALSSVSVVGNALRLRRVPL